MSVSVIKDVSQSTGEHDQTVQRLQQRNQELERQLAERTQSLQASEQRLQLALHSGQMGLWEWDVATDKLSWDERMCSLYSIRPEEFTGRYTDWERHIHPKDLAILKQMKANGLQHRFVTLAEFRVICPDGTTRHISNSYLLQSNDQGEVQRVIGINMDITARKQAELALQNSQQFIQQIADVSSNLFYLYDLQEQRNVYVNQTISTVLGYTSSEIQAMGKNLFHWLMHPDDLGRIPEQVKRLNQSREGEIQEFEYRMRHADGEWHWLYSRDAVFSRDDTGQVKLAIGAAQDVSLLKKLEAQLEEHKVKLAQVNRAKDEFLANMSHELRTPLTAILGMSSALLEGIFGDFNPNQQHYLEAIHNSGQHLLEIINDLLDLSRIAAGDLELNMSLVSIRELCLSSLEMIQQPSLEKQMQLNMIIAPNLDLIWMDEHRIRQVLKNLLSNAVKFTPSGGQITLEVNLGRVFSETSQIEFMVKDTGIGIAPEDQLKLFQPFVQIDSSLNRRYDGTGIELALVKQIVELHGGSVSLTSQVGVGSCFTVRLPGGMSPNE